MSKLDDVLSLEERQKFSQEVEALMVATLMEFEPTQELRVRDVMAIARTARLHAFDALNIMLAERKS